MSLFIHHNFMRMSELVVIKLLINVKFIDDYSVKLVFNLLYNRNMYDNKYNFMYNMIFISIKLLVGSWPTCQPDQKSHMADCIIFKF